MSMIRSAGFITSNYPSCSNIGPKLPIYLSFLSPDYLEYACKIMAKKFVTLKTLHFRANQRKVYISFGRFVILTVFSDKASADQMNRGGEPEYSTFCDKLQGTGTKNPTGNIPAAGGIPVRSYIHC
jgi:hypothetical protein